MDKKYKKSTNFKVIYFYIISSINEKLNKYTQVIKNIYKENYYV